MYVQYYLYKQIYLFARTFPKLYKKCYHETLKFINCPLYSKDYLFTGSEDTFIKVISATDCELKLEQTLRSHLSSVRAMHLVDYTNDKKFLVSAGGRAEFKIWLLNFNAQRNVISVAEVASKMLKGNDKQRQKSWKVISS